MCLNQEVRLQKNSYAIVFAVKMTRIVFEWIITLWALSVAVGQYQNMLITSPFRLLEIHSHEYSVCIPWWMGSLFIRIWKEKLPIPYRSKTLYQWTLERERNTQKCIIVTTTTKLISSLRPRYAYNTSPFECNRNVRLPRQKRRSSAVSNQEDCIQSNSTLLWPPDPNALYFNQH